MNLDRLRDTFDFALTENGDLALTKETTGDLSVATGTPYLVQQIQMRIKECELERLIGQPNTQEVAEQGREMILLAICDDTLVGYDDVYVEPVPMSRYLIHYFVFIKSPDEAAREELGIEFEESADPIGFEVALHLSNGASIRRIM